MGRGTRSEVGKRLGREDFSNGQLQPGTTSAPSMASSFDSTTMLEAER